MIHTELADVTALDAGEMASVAGGIDWGKIVGILYRELDDFVDGVKDGYSAAT